MANTKLQRMARIRAYCTGESYQQALTALAEDGGVVPLGRSEELQQADYYRQRDGDNSLLRTCPQCDMDTFVDTRDNLLPKHLGPTETWFCYCCLFTAAAAHIAECLSCGQPTTDAEISMCSDCMGYQMA